MFLCLCGIFMHPNKISFIFIWIYSATEVPWQSHYWYPKERKQGVTEIGVLVGNPEIPTRYIFFSLERLSQCPLQQWCLTADSVTVNQWISSKPDSCRHQHLLRRSPKLVGCRRDRRFFCGSRAQGLKKKEHLKRHGRGQREYDVACRKKPAQWV